MNVDIEQIIAWYGEAMIENRVLRESLQAAQAEIARLETELGNTRAETGTGQVPLRYGAGSRGDAEWPS